MGITITIANQKGGVGKTTLTVHLARLLADHGKHVVVVDADPQANATTWILDQPDDGLWNLLVNETDVAHVTRFSNGWGFAVLPGSVRTGDAMLLASRRPFHYIRDSLQPLDDVADYVLIDMPPSRAAGFQELLYSSKYVLVPTELERHAFDGIKYMAQTCTQIRARHKSGPQLLGIVPNKMRSNTIEHQAQLAMLTRTFKATVWPIVPIATKIPEACALGVTVFDHAPDNPASVQLRKVAQRLLENTRGG